jgi:hypothetical protein
MPTSEAKPEKCYQENVSHASRAAPGRTEAMRNHLGKLSSSIVQDAAAQ